MKKKNKSHILKGEQPAQAGPASQPEQPKPESPQEAFLRHYEAKACNISQACKASGIGRTTFYGWKKDFPVFAEQCDEIEKSLIDYTESKLLKNIKDGKETSIFFFLCNRAPERWKHIQRIEHTGFPEAPENYIIIHEKENDVSPVEANVQPDNSAKK